MLYDYECPECGKKWDEHRAVVDRHTARCEECGVLAIKLISVKMRVITFDPMWYNDICEDPIYVTSKNQLRDECKRHDVLSARLM